MSEENREIRPREISVPPTSLRIFKYHALGNSYLVLDPRDTKGSCDWFVRIADGSLRPSIELVTLLCNQSRGVGSNGLLFGPVHISDTNTFDLCIINSDGTRSGFSGNGIRIFAKYLLDRGYLRGDDSLGVRTLLDDGIDGQIRAPVNVSDKESGRIDVTLPYPPRFGPDAVGIDKQSIRDRADNSGLSFTVKPIARLGEALTGSKEAWADSVLVDIGNPHCTTFVRDPAHLPSRQKLLSCDEALRAIAFRPEPTGDPLPVFANGVNLQWIRVANREQIDLVVYERGEGPTEASGSSASAAASAAYARGLVGPNIMVNMPGGSLVVKIVAETSTIASVTLSGFAARILEAFIDPNLMTA